ncbi:sulfatase-modifying factor 2 [Biomphalaria glabrata]|uniref:Inactive C-alpha-formylglycine-generating enzyme 2-like n=1 Tax=Biomphalaria glabrata TaxID=6526 RepID=A0A2C9L3P1_BIOGL|nr:inactive C-alpha-formylglycine-generating enzyme 2-like [Biomphalaria glabrata]XP_013070064.1 inactive C-alpha-formylglycine-generating enzyme 2-like [Biomphalaria glabrata]XP_055864649.1 inactive C-alpha-formylglycine-generating enzyme 2-like [Biomphalaria glabrata]XP_055864650.1 inactive C-alpha-formylglycine-generating enzyme 2-like [Biomphalaria glabrata]XP_055864651.1 inactive C-alpha-formylglycine-generating enzyme 2-like [Biomphalaria glabrata]KAI8736253.1 sulfatase-modifying factor 
MPVVSRGLLLSAIVSVFALLWATGSADLTDDQLKAMEAVNVKQMLKNEIKMGAKEHRRQGVRKYEGEVEQTEQNYTHPFFKPGIVNEIRYSYRKYREMIFLKEGKFWMGTNDPDSKTGEYPMRNVAVKSFYFDTNPVINAEYWAFRAQKKFVKSEAEKKGWSWVVDMFLSDETRDYYSMPGARGWSAVKKASWDKPEGPDSNLEERWKHPVVHISWYDAKMFCEFHGKRLPTEPEWEYAARAGVKNRAYPWGDNWERRRANVWQGDWPYENRKADGYAITSPVDAYKPQNLIGLYDMIGNVWEWTSSSYVERGVQPHLQSSMVVLKGGSYVDSVNGKINAAVRNGQRMGQKQDYTAANVGFRCAKSAPEFDTTTTSTVQTTTPYKERVPKFHRREKNKDEL